MEGRVQFAAVIVVLVMFSWRWLQVSNYERTPVDADQVFNVLRGVIPTFRRTQYIDAAIRDIVTLVGSLSNFDAAQTPFQYISTWIRLAGRTLSLAREVGMLRGGASPKRALSEALVTLERLYSPSDWTRGYAFSSQLFAATPPDSPRAPPEAILPWSLTAHVRAVGDFSPNVPAAIFTATTSQGRREAEAWLAWWNAGGPIRGLAATLDCASEVATGLLRLDDQWIQLLDEGLASGALGEAARNNLGQTIGGAAGTDAVVFESVPNLALLMEALGDLRRLSVARVLGALARQAWTDQAQGMLADLHGIPVACTTPWFPWMHPESMKGGIWPEVIDSGIQVGLDGAGGNPADTQLTSVILGRASTHPAQGVGTRLGLGNGGIRVRAIFRWPDAGETVVLSGLLPMLLAEFQRDLQTQRAALLALGQAPNLGVAGIGSAIGRAVTALMNRGLSVPLGQGALTLPDVFLLIRNVNAVLLLLKWLIAMCDEVSWPKYFDATVGAHGVRRVL